MLYSYVDISLLLSRNIACTICMTSVCLYKSNIFYSQLICDFCVIIFFPLNFCCCKDFYGCTLIYYFFWLLTTVARLMCGIVVGLRCRNKKLCFGGLKYRSKVPLLLNWCLWKVRCYCGHSLKDLFVADLVH